MKITRVKYYDLKENNCQNYLGKCSIVIEDCLILHDIRILDGKKGRYVIMPEKSKAGLVTSGNINKEGEDVFHPVSHSFFDYMKKVILTGYKEYETKGESSYSPN